MVYSFLVGGLFTYFELSSGSGKHISLSTIRTMYITFSAFALIGVIIICFLRKPAHEKLRDPEAEKPSLLFAFCEFGSTKMPFSGSARLCFNWNSQSFYNSINAAASSNFHFHRLI